MQQEEFLKNTISPLDSILAFEALSSSFSDAELSKTIAKYGKLPSVEDLDLEKNIQKKITSFLEPKFGGFSVSIHGDFQYPERLQDADNPLELFYYKGNIDLAHTKCVSVVGSRKSTPEGEKRAKRIAELLVKHNITIVSGLAQGIDTVALKTAMELGGNVIAVIGTPIDQYYPKENIGLQDQIAKEHLLISQVPFYRYDKEPFSHKRYYFPKRNITMSALSEGTIIVEASNTSGTLTQARAALKQNRKLFILNNCFQNKELTWPNNFLKKGAIKVEQEQDIINNLSKASTTE